jgi:zinc transport system substrate-binding protein
MKKYLLIAITLIMIFTLSGCKKDSMEGIDIYTTIYPIEFITNKLYGDYSNVSSIYPNEVIKLSDKLLQDYSSGDLFIYNGLSAEKDYAVKMLNNNQDLMIVDATMGMDVEYSDEELWLNPSNFLMLCLNIKNGMKEYITNTYLKKQIDNNYDELKLLVSELDAETKLMVENATDSNTILVSNDLFKYLEKYNLNIISLEDNSDLNDVKIAEAKTAIDSGTIKYIIMMPNDTLSDKVEELIANNNIEKLYFNSITTLSESDEKNGKDYLSIMRENLELLKKELYVE